MNDPLDPHMTSSKVIDFRQDLLTNFFQKNIRKYGANWDYIITIRRKGTFIFKDLSEGHPITKNDITSFDLDNMNLSDFNYKNILLFDDSICTGNTIQSYIDMFPKSNITVASIVTQADIKRSIEENNENVRIIGHFLKNSKKEHEQFYFGNMALYFDYICVPQLTLLSDEFAFPMRLERNEIEDLFTIGETKPRECETWNIPIKYENRFKMGLDFNEREIEEIMSKLFPGSHNTENAQCKVRLFIHKSETETKVYVEYIIGPDFDLPKCNKPLESCYDNNFLEKNMICPLCFTVDFADIIRNQIKENLKSKKVCPKVSTLEWYFNGRRIDLGKSIVSN